MSRWLIYPAKPVFSVWGVHRKWLKIRESTAKKPTSHGTLHTFRRSLGEQLWELKTKRKSKQKSLI
jgi:hypothetical protein